MTLFTKSELQKLWRPNDDSTKGENGSVTIIGGSDLFQGAPLMAAITASRLVDSVFIATPFEDKEIIGKIELFSRLRPVIWVPREDIEVYIQKSDAILIGPGLMRYHKELSNSYSTKEFDKSGSETRSMTKYFLQKFPEKKWVIDGGSLQVMDKEWIPSQAILTCNDKEFELLFNLKFEILNLKIMAQKYNCVIVHKGVVTYVSDGETTYEIEGGNAGLTKGGTGDVQAGLTVGLAAKNPSLLAAAAAALVIKATADKLYEKVGFNYNADDVTNEVFLTLHQLIS